MAQMTLRRGPRCTHASPFTTATPAVELALGDDRRKVSRIPCGGRMPPLHPNASDQGFVPPSAGPASATSGLRSQMATSQLFQRLRCLYRTSI